MALAVGAMSGCQAPPTAAPAAVARQQLPSPPAPPTGSSGDFIVSLTAESDCDNLPPLAKQRSWEARIEPAGAHLAARRQYPAGGVTELVTLLGSRFLNGDICTMETEMGCDQFIIHRGADGVDVYIDSTDADWGHGGRILEQLSTGAWIEVHAGGKAPVGPVIDAQLNGSIWFCPESRGYPFPCTTFTSCSRPKLRMTITPKPQ